MCRFFLLLLLMAIIVPFLEASNGGPNPNGDNEDKKKGRIKQCYGGQFDSLGNYEKENCTFNNNDGCRTVECKTPGGYFGSCGKCPANKEDLSFGCYECTDCIGELCNAPKSKGNINKCYGGQIGHYKEENCTFFNNDGCYTMDCTDYFNDPRFNADRFTNPPIYPDPDRINGPGDHSNGRGKRLSPVRPSSSNIKLEQKHCGKCPAVVPKGCKCTDCVGDMCNKEDLVNQCYWGDNKKGYEAIDCKADGLNNKACRKVKCLGTGSASSKDYRDCGKCPPQDKDCKCFECNDQDLCNASFRYGSPSFMLILAMIGGVFTLLAMKPLMDIGI